MKFCKDCKWAKKSFWENDWYYARCYNPKVEKFFPSYAVSGIPLSCRMARDIELEQCGPHGKFFEKK